jgi:hypothetical protein
MKGKLDVDSVCNAVIERIIYFTVQNSEIKNV